jgi:streptogramin lyase
VGCSSSFTTEPSGAGKTAIGRIQGDEHGGRAPISGAHVYVYAAGTSGYAGSATSLLQPGIDTIQDGNGHYYVLTDATGAFSISGEYTCIEGTQVYLVAAGGDAGSGHNNSAIVQMAALGQCPASGHLADNVPYVSINEISTVVMAYAAGGFGSTAYNVSSSGTALAQTGIANGFANVPNIMSVANGFPLTSATGNPNSSVPQAKIISLANILAACVNSDGPTSTSCTRLFNLARAGETNASDEAAAIFNIAHNPTANVNALFALIPTIPAFAGGLTTVPADYTLPIVYNGVVRGPNNIAFDADGNAWISDSTKDAVIEVGPQGLVFTYTNGGTFGSISNVAIAPGSAGTIWAADSINDQLYLLSPSGVIRTTVIRGGLNSPSGIAFDQFGQAYVVNAANLNISKFSPLGVSLSTSTYSPFLLTSAAIAVDFSGNVYTPTNGGAGGIGCLEVGQTAGYYYPDLNFGTKLNSGTGIALDSTSNVPTTMSTNGTFSNAVWQTVTDGSLFGFQLIDYSRILHGVSFSTSISNYGGVAGSSLPATVSVDGAGNLWVANAGTNTVSGFTNAGTALARNGFPTGAGTNSDAYAAAVDGSGNVWTANSDGTVTQLLGLSVPVATPIFPGQFGVRP